MMVVILALMIAMMIVTRLVAPCVLLLMLTMSFDGHAAAADGD